MWFFKIHFNRILRHRIAVDPRQPLVVISINRGSYSLNVIGRGRGDPIEPAAKSREEAATRVH
jgi:hypothetical protein